MKLTQHKPYPVTDGHPGTEKNEGVVKRDNSSNMDEEDLGEALPLTGVGAMFIDEAIRSLSEQTIPPCQTLEDVHALLKKVTVYSSNLITFSNPPFLCIFRLSEEYTSITLFSDRTKTCSPCVCTEQPSARHNARWPLRRLPGIAEVLDPICGPRWSASRRGRPPELLEGWLQSAVELR